MKETLANALKIKFKLPPNRPTDSELNLIIKIMKDIPQNERTFNKWREITLDVVKFSGSYIYKGLDNSDLNYILTQILKEL